MIFLIAKKRFWRIYNVCYNKIRNTIWLILVKNGTISEWKLNLFSQELQYKLPLPKASDPSIEEQLSYICQKTRFRHAARVMERIIANNVFAMAQKRFAGLVKRDPCDLDLKFDYRLELLWTHTCKIARNRPVAASRWSPANASILAVAYGAKTGEKDKANGLLLIWCAKNPSQPAREYTFDSPLSDIDWSRERPNLLAIGLYDGSIKVIDVSAKELNLIRQSRRETSPACLPHWQVRVCAFMCLAPLLLNIFFK